MKSFKVPFPLEVDAYQAGMFLMIPPGMESFQASFLANRTPLRWGDPRSDHRVVSAGLMPFTMLELDDCRVSMKDVEMAEDYFHTFGPGGTQYPFPKELFVRVVNEFEGKLPVCVMGVPDGQAMYIGEPTVLMWTDVPGMGELVGWLESTLIPYTSQSTACATRGRVRKDLMLEVYKKAYPNLGEEVLLQMIGPMFHDFGRRGAPAAQITGIAHLLNWLGTDTVDAAFVAQYYLNGGRPFGACSIPAAAHRTVTTWATEDASIRNMIEKFGSGMFSFVADSYDYEKCLHKLAGYMEIVRVKGGWIVGRPDSGDPVQCVLKGLEVFSEAFGYTRTDVTQLKKITGASIIQGDGMSDTIMFQKLFPAVLAHGYAPDNVAVGMGEYNHRAVRSDLEQGFKTCLVGVAEEAEGEITDYRPSMKNSSTPWKRSIPGVMSVHFANGEMTNRVCPISVEQLKRGEVGDFRVVFDGRPNGLPTSRWTFDESRELAWRTYKELLPITADTYHPELRRMQDVYLANMANAA